MYKEETRAITVEVEPIYLETESAPERSRYMWEYRVTILNTSEETVQLMKRFWDIVDATGHRQNVSGTGVVGVQPILRPGEEFHYSSGVPLQASSGIMRGHYTMKTETGEEFDVLIPAFSLDSPHNTPILN